MAWIIQCLHSPLPRMVALALTAIGVVACSGETRFDDNPFSNKASPEATGSIQPGTIAASRRMDSYPTAVQSVQLPPPTITGSVPATPGVAGGGKGMGSYSPTSSSETPSASAVPEVTGAVPTLKPVSGRSGNWSWDGGTAITVGSGDTVGTIARRYGVPASAIIQANNLRAPATIHPGQQLVIPRYQASHAPAAGVKVASAAAMPAAGGSGVHVVAPGETLSKISRLYGKSVRELAKANNISPNAHLNVGARLVIPGVRTSAASPQSTPAVAESARAPEATSSNAEPPQSASVFKQVEPATTEGGKHAEETGSLPKFRWPANGRVITAFGPTTNGQQNDGINIAVPENTPVKAAEDGVVAYAGNELKGYGNLVLVRHPNGYVTAYAHAKELLVKRGDQVKRGQVIARSGQSGNVNAPQLHFEIRKGAAPVDPTKFLSGA
jgi:murein DD-endopeptidase MepM/ murein hydrolase activator NlpD